MFEASKKPRDTKTWSMTIKNEPKTDKNLNESDTNKRKRPTFTDSGLLLKQKRTLYDSYENLFIISTISAIAIFAAVLRSEFSR